MSLRGLLLSVLFRFRTTGNLSSLLASGPPCLILHSCRVWLSPTARISRAFTAGEVCCVHLDLITVRSSVHRGSINRNGIGTFVELDGLPGSSTASGRPIHIDCTLTDHLADPIAIYCVADDGAVYLWTGKARFWETISNPRSNPAIQLTLARVDAETLKRPDLASTTLKRGSSTVSLPSNVRAISFGPHTSFDEDSELWLLLEEKTHQLTRFDFKRDSFQPVAFHNDPRFQPRRIITGSRQYAFVLDRSDHLWMHTDTDIHRPVSTFSDPKFTLVQENVRVAATGRDGIVVALVGSELRWWDSENWDDSQ